MHFIDSGLMMILLGASVLWTVMVGIVRHYENGEPRYYMTTRYYTGGLWGILALGWFITNWPFPADNPAHALTATFAVWAIILLLISVSIWINSVRKPTPAVEQYRARKAERLR
ncbi:hypothetical protein KC949_02560 [Candidatus Saccharibacteria bacterium]|nr:hypothetical protein [Candidatus Saccharibacteria bacterium]